MMFNGKLTVTHHHRATVQEISVEMNGFSFLCLFGRHINGAYISIVSLGVSAELSPSKMVLVTTLTAFFMLYSLLITAEEV